MQGSLAGGSGGVAVYPTQGTLQVDQQQQQQQGLYAAQTSAEAEQARVYAAQASAEAEQQRDIGSEYVVAMLKKSAQQGQAEDTLGGVSVEVAEEFV